MKRMNLFNVTIFSKMFLTGFIVLSLLSCDKDDISIDDLTANNLIEDYFGSEPTYVSVPVKAVADAFKKDFPVATNEKWDVANNIYRASFVDGESALKSSSASDNNKSHAWYGKDGKKLQHKKDVKVKNLPQAVLDAIAARYPGYKIDDAEIIFRNGEKFYEIEVEKGDDDIEFYINEDGTFRDGSSSNSNNDGLRNAKQHFRQNFPNAEDVEWDVFKNVIRVEFEWEDRYDDDDDDWEAYYDKSGSFLRTKQEIDDDKLPSVIRQDIRTRYGKVEIDDAWRVTANDNTVTYEIALEGKNDKEWLVIYTENGKFVSETVRYDDDDDNDDGNKNGTEKWIDNAGKTKQPGNSRDVRNNTNGFGKDSYTAISFEGETTLYAKNYGFGKTDGDNYNIKLYTLKDGTYTHIGDIYGKGDNLQIDVLAGHKIRVVWQRHQIENSYYVVELTGKFSTTYKKDFKGENTGYTSGNVYVKYLK